MEKFVELKKVTDRLFQEKKIEEHPLFMAINNGDFSDEQRKEIALQIYHVVLYFPRFLSAILTNMSDYRMRMPLVENLFEEHGKMNEKYVHSETYKEFLTGIGVSEEEIKESKPSIAVIAYNRGLTDLCLHYHYLEGLAALGVIEEIVARVSPLVGQFAKSNYGSENKSLVHFTDHEVLDVQHANEIYEVVALSYDGDQKQIIERGLQFGMYYHSRMYTDILEEVRRLA
ncbi:TenA family transcriptional regulator [Bacillus sp. REN16]|uniref:TenA family transcriptional regulator n=1 Tax=Bacillus sp. REN16 TaxID=2887296 RepID=UPI001E33D82E|nr:iron-containing redox enzyme family protein [Bacillus sp. REN16]MCC3355385.1 iron-containing redox enzyme family protein [Bacillus sp. REN16]